MTINEQAEHTEDRKQLSEKIRATIGSLAAVSALAGGVWLGLHMLDAKPQCGDTVELSSATPSAYMDIEGRTYGVDVSSMLGEAAVTVTEGGSFQELQTGSSTTIRLSQDRNGRLSGTAKLVESDVTFSATADDAMHALTTSCKTN